MVCCRCLKSSVDLREVKGIESATKEEERRRGGGRPLIVATAAFVSKRTGQAQ